MDFLVRYESSVKSLFLGDDPNGVNDAGNVTQKGEQDVQPEMQAEAHLEENADRREQNG